MEPPLDAPDRTDEMIVVECPLHGLFLFGPKTDFAAGPPKSET